jgi:hypothetical protein
MRLHYNISLGAPSLNISVISRLIFGWTTAGFCIGRCKGDFRITQVKGLTFVAPKAHMSFRVICIQKSLLQFVYVVSSIAHMHIGSHAQ